MALRYPLSTEKAIRLMESENKILFVVDRRDRKENIKKDFENSFDVQVDSIRTLINRNGDKVAYLKLKPEYLAVDVATNLGLM
ncbi:MAG: 50S ribosomal protein L23 [Nanobdellota archaeon]